MRPMTEHCPSCEHPYLFPVPMDNRWCSTDCLLESLYREPS